MLAGGVSRTEENAVPKAIQPSHAASESGSACWLLAGPSVPQGSRPPGSLRSFVFSLASLQDRILSRSFQQNRHASASAS